MALNHRVLVVVFLRGAADGLNLVPPHADKEYYALRPALAIPRPDDARFPSTERARDLDAHFGLHPKLAPLAPAFVAKELAIVHPVGSDDATRSHFEASDRMEHAGATERDEGSGWLARHLRTRSGPAPRALSAVAIGPSIPESLRGAPSASAVESIERFRLG